ncbi:hypothetical protein A5699_22000 [Mycobacterium sp. E802]|uniref:EspA/EspE family type VII secretion system effector n=1 Tax=Mycobacterium sp. E802 TaxID=1834152 RepID=UPI0007FC99CB|nr:EspA/EspE family type VII secretion system effector [Mycobacterium sp. E802]OBG86311.1 hypothetical protein A5699_22000 [Mycobacterium sp. E802]
MGALDAFYTTWSQARATFGEGAPTTGDSFDGSARLREMQSTIESAAPDHRWQGTASQAYAAKNAEHAAVYGKLADLDQRMAAEVTNSAAVVSAGRRNLGDLQKWIEAADASIPGGQSGNTMRMILARKGLSQLSETVQRSTEEMSAIGRKVADIRGQYDAITSESRKAAGWKENPPPVTADDNRTHDEKVAEWFVKLNEWNQKVAKLTATRPPESAPEGVKIAWNEERHAEDAAAVIRLCTAAFCCFTAALAACGTDAPMPSMTVQSTKAVAAVVLPVEEVRTISGVTGFHDIPELNATAPSAVSDIPEPCRAVFDPPTVFGSDWKQFDTAGYGADLDAPVLPIMADVRQAIAVYPDAATAQATFDRLAAAVPGCISTGTGYYRRTAESPDPNTLLLNSEQADGAHTAYRLTGAALINSSALGLPDSERVAVAILDSLEQAEH